LNKVNSISSSFWVDMFSDLWFIFKESWCLESLFKEDNNEHLAKQGPPVHSHPQSTELFNR
jgi:hypothetical protein